MYRSSIKINLFLIILGAGSTITLIGVVMESGIVPTSFVTVSHPREWFVLWGYKSPSAEYFEDDRKQPYLRRHLQQQSERTEFANFTWPPMGYPNPDGSGTYSYDTSSDGRITSDAVPAVMVAVASSIIFCAALLYISDLRDRWYHQRMMAMEERSWQNKENAKRIQDGVVHCDPYHRHQLQTGAFPMLPPSNNDQPQYVEEISISPVSTMTASLALDSHGIPRTDSDNYLDDSVNITELSDLDRVSQGTDLHSLVDLSRIQTTAPFSISDEGSASDCHSRGILTFQDSSQEDKHIHIHEGAADYVMSEVEEDESGWTSSAEKSESSSEMSVATYLRSVHSVKSRSSSAESRDTSPPNLHKDSEKELFGERCLPEEESSEGCSLERSPDTPVDMHGCFNTFRNELHQLEQLYGGKQDLEATQVKKLSLLEQLLEQGCQQQQHHENDCKSGGSQNADGQRSQSAEQEYVRSIFYVPMCSSVATPTDLGLEVENASCASSHPCVKSIHEDSPLRGRIFAGDQILAVNNEATMGLGAKETTKIFTSDDPHHNDGESHSITGVVKLTVLSLQCDGSVTSDSESSDSTIDIDIVSTAIEV